jgi:hypothetical protein
MKRIIVLFACVLLLFSCNKNNKAQNGNFENESEKEQIENNNFENDSTKEQIIIKEIGNKQNPLYGKIYSKITDIPEFKQWKGRSFKRFSIRGYVLSVYQDENENWYFFLDDDMFDCFKILDTINIGKLEDREHAAMMGFSLNGTYYEEIIGVISIDEEVDNKLYGEIINVWQIDWDTGTIIPIDTEGIDWNTDSGRPLLKKKK